MSDAAQHCEALVREADKDRFLATLFAPAATRPDLFALYAFDIETAAVAHRVREPLAGEIRLQWWSDAITGKADSAGHPVAEAFLAMVTRHVIPVALALGVIEGRQRALYPDWNPGEAEFELLASETLGAIYQAAAHILAGAPTEATKLACHHAGVATTAAQMSSSEIPFDLMLVARHHLDAVKALITSLPDAVLPAFLPLALIAHDRAQLPQWRKQWVLWRASRNLSAWL
ncbi:phytoene/squalene synthase family protein [Pseudorhodoplanes sinuspersici]|uniref:Uncharacterized protein n=1 Tax=Pseudorhodoplanes sinuspersici TaxID=1235591 RepID=A0A1W6ZYG2_9HYPH|nr:squalene/phytoene synthase family protein [Pseudorhodoplanes sinuspersici]ARQ01785.1 hypothetical protein CAK95_23820 [Pseudorhodoplanes sinuspersici]RKE73536.1 phytoene synthase [Pseudorhodoplanes sinuspersici]